MTMNPQVRRLSGARRRTAALVVGAAVVLGAVGGGAWFVTHRDASPESAAAASTAAPVAVVPQPVELVETGGEPFHLTASTRLLADGEGAVAVAQRLADLVRPATGFPVEIVSTAGMGSTGATSSDITLTIDPAVAGAEDSDEHSEEAYTLTAGADGVAIVGASEHGLFDGVQTLRQLLPAFIESDTPVRADWQVPAVTITDAPRFAYRALMVDVARSFQSVDELKAIIDAMAAVKLSVLHLHLADDQGWRIEITNEGRVPGDDIDYTLLTGVSGRTAMVGEGYLGEDGHTGYYTQDDYRQIVEYAAQHHIEVVPEVDMPAHTNAALHAIAQLNTPGSSHEGTASEPTAPSNGTTDVGYSYLDPDSEVTYTFVEHVLGQLAAMTPGTYLHIGGDESHAMTERYGSDRVAQFVGRVVDIVHGLGKSTVGWNEYAATTLTAGDAVQYWTSDDGESRRAVEQDGAKLVLSPSGQSYLDMQYSGATAIGLRWACSRACDFPEYYDWNPQDVVDGVDDAGILGVEAALWSETVRGGEQAEFMAFPRVVGHAEIGWSPQSARTADDYARRLAALGPRLVVAGTNFYDSPKATWRTALAGTDVPAGSGPPYDVGLLAAPGTVVADDGADTSAQVAVDTLDDGDGVSASALTAPLTAVIDWGDGTEPSAATFTTTTPRGVLSSSGIYTISGEHEYAEPGTYEGTVTTSDGRTVPFTVPFTGTAAAG